MNTPKKVRFHIIHNYTSANKGWATVVISTAYNIRKIIPNAEFTIESYNPEIDAKLYAPFGINIISKIISSKSDGLILFTKVLFWRLLRGLHIDSRYLVEYGKLRTYYNSNIILDLAGDTLCIPFETHKAIFYFRRNILAILGHAYLFILLMLLKKPIVIYAQTIGPIGITEPLIKMLLNKMSLITVREEESMDYLVKIGVSSPSILTADPAFSLPTISNKEIDNIIENEAIETKKPIIGMCLSSETARYHFRDDLEKFTKLFATVIDTLIDRYDVQVVLVPFSTWKGHGGDDRVVSREIIAQIKRKHAVKLLKSEYNPVELRGLISKCALFIGSRGHSCMIALSSNVPTIAVGHNPKFFGIMKMVGLEQYVCKAHELTISKLLSLISCIWNDKETIRKELENKMTIVRSLSILNAELVGSIVQKLYD